MALLPPLSPQGPQKGPNTGAYRGDWRARRAYAGITLLAPLGLLLAWPQVSRAGPGQADRLAGAEAQGPATRSVTAMHHNPAMLGALSGFHFQANVRGGLDHRRARRFGLLDDGGVSKQLGTAENLIDPTADFFVGGSFSFDPVAIAIGVYSLSNRLRFTAPQEQRYQLAFDPDVAGGAYDLHNDFTLAFAWSPIRSVHFGGAVHAPVIFLGRSRDEDTYLLGDGVQGVGCGAVQGTGSESGACAEYLSVRTKTAAFNLNVTVGAAIEVTPSLTLGVRYRSPLWLNEQAAKLDGKATVCLSDEAADAELYDTSVPRCSEANKVKAEASIVLPQEAAIGLSSTFGDDDQWQLDTNLYWVDRCRGWSTGIGSRCDDADSIHTSLVGLDQTAAVLPDFKIYRGYQDLFGLELWGRKRIWGQSPKQQQGHGDADEPGHEHDAAEETHGKGPLSGLSLLFGAGLRTPGVRRGSVTVVESELWTMSANLGARLTFKRRGQSRRRRGGWYIVPGYGLDMVLPSKVGGSSGQSSDFAPQAALDFAASDRDINGPGADAVLAGRARPTNAGSYFQDVHVFSIGVGWNELPF